MAKTRRMLVNALVIAAMCVPFFARGVPVYAYWASVATAYLAYVALSRW
jgi:alpha-D-ribose 1-methylphosphonate 5-phosphate C-P lyase